MLERLTQVHKRSRFMPRLEDVDPLPEHRLWLSVLERAVRDAKRYLSYPVKPKNPNYGLGSDGNWYQFGREAHRWIYSNEFCEQSYLWVCEAIGLNPTIVRSYLKEGCH